MNETDTKAKYQHLIPKTYLSAWANSAGTLQVEFVKTPGITATRNKDNIAGMNDFYSIKAGMPFCTKADTDAFFAPLKDYHVFVNGKEIKDSLELNNLYWCFDDWVVTRDDGTIVSKKSLKREIEKIKIKDIEVNWSIKYENHWNKTVDEIEKRVLNSQTQSVAAFRKDYIMKFFVALNWRGFRSNKQFEENLNTITQGLFDDIKIPLNERELPNLKTAKEEIRHELLLQYYRKYLNDDGIIYACAEANLKYTNFHFLISDGPTKFCTSDSPAFVHKRDDGLLVGLFPITPRILLAQGKCTDENNQYYITHITDDTVKKYNSIIRNYATEFIIYA